MNTTMASSDSAIDSNSSTSPLLVVDDIRTSFVVPNGEVKAVRGVSFELNQGKTLGVVGEAAQVKPFGTFSHAA